MNYKLLNINIFIWLLFLASAILFISYPQIDLYFSSLFYTNGFYLRGSMYEMFFYKSVPILITFFATATLSLFAYNFFTKKSILGVNGRVAIYCVLVLSLAPGLIVNTILKEHWGRARPAEIVQFGGTKKFTPAFVISDQGGNSFSSGHGAAAFSLLGFALLAKRRRKFWIALALSYGIAVSFARIIAGGHFLSDNITSFFIVYITTYILYSYIIENKS